MKLVKKITIGHVEQVYDIDNNRWISQNFIAGDEVDYEDQDGNNLSSDEILNLPYLPFDMASPDEQVLALSDSHDLSIKVVATFQREFTESEKESAGAFIENIVREIRKNNVLSDNRAIQAQKYYLLGCFPDQYIFAEPVENQGNGVMPWYQVTTRLGHFVIGCRQNFIVVNWEKTTIQDQADDVFPNENTTKVGRMIHALGCEKAKEYLSKLHSL